MKYYKKVEGEKCYLSPVNVDDYIYFTEWLNDVEITYNLQTFMSNINLINEKAFLEDICKKGDHTYEIIVKKNNIPIGICGLKNIDFNHRNAELGIFIGNKEYLNKKYGEEAIKLLLDIGFNILNMHNIYLKVHSFNKRAINCYKKCGFSIIGKQREALNLFGKRYDIIYMDILANEYKSYYLLKKIKLEDQNE